VLVVEGHAASRAHLAHVLRERGADITESPSVDEACAWLNDGGRVRCADVVVLGLPSEPAAAVERLLAASPGSEVVALATATQRVCREALRVAATVERPVKMGALVAAVTKLAQRAGATRAHAKRVARPSAGGGESITTRVIDSPAVWLVRSHR
jgi:DNA-binding response OmpR family regulator